MLRPLCVLAGAAELAATALFAWYAFGLGSIGGAFSGTLALGILALRAILALALGLYAWRCLCREWRNGPPLLTTPGPPLPALALLILLPADLELLQLVPWRRRQLDGLPTAALLGLTATLSLSHNLATLLLLAYTAAAVAPPPLRPLPVVCGVLALACAAFLGIRRAAMLLGCCGADAAAEQKYDACTASAEAAMPASVAAVDLEMAERGEAGGAAAVAPGACPLQPRGTGTSSPAARRAVTRQREAAARARIESKKRLAGERYRARLGRARAASAPDTADAACAAARAAASGERRPSAPTDCRNNSPAANRAAAAAAAAEARARRASAPRPAPPTALEVAAAAIAAAAEATALEEDAAASIAADEAAADDGGGDLEPSAPLVPAETPGVDRTAAGGADPASYTQRLNRAREASQPQDAESKFGSYVGRLRRARESNDAKDPNSASSRRILAAAAAAQTGAPAAEPGCRRAECRRAERRRAEHRHRPRATRLG